MGKSVATIIYQLVRKIPRGEVMTYGQIALRLRSGSVTGITPRLVGRALHLNPDPAGIPCHRVVNRNGKLAQNFAFGGWRRQRELLLKEGVRFKDKMHVDLNALTLEKAME